ncbi:winged helix-turn-helix domain-containing protein [Novosphingobium album (ex Hu et al. 2023)]|uniref:Winged helix-turn-helix domain-containing protein n=1 Tax=Novosphingobium album (ex Hu et al. 2023) TaxID=2930093 RepID=A0ABT0B0J5_9SPHN|nr:winged helix-turn-helix domain-containing protein [Novosphingobium album (ex Hu et al. 2023)]MCJ2178456.1 winged helix-turn-helix domain-containing protein [Novosphingobium album (ex Hu et al. 2023)]
MGVSNQRGGDSYQFCWLGVEDLPSALDLRRDGWSLNEGDGPSADCIGIINAGNLDSVAWTRVLSTYPEEARRYILVTGVKRAGERTMLLQHGFADVVSDTIALEELGARAARVADFSHWLPRQRQFGMLRLDLLAREAHVDTKPLNLNPREFALLWRLADSPNRPVSKQTLIHDVWRMGFVPETNSIAVHMSRLRRKLAIGGLQGVIETVQEGGYCLRIGDTPGKYPASKEHAAMRFSGQGADKASNWLSLPI